MADKIEFGQVVVPVSVPVTITGEDKLANFAKTLNSMTRNNNYAAYWKEQSELIRDVADAAEQFNKTNSSVDAKNLINSFNALKAVSDDSAKSIISDNERVAKSLEDAVQRIGSSVVGEMSVENFKGAFDSFNMLKAYGLETEEIFRRISTTSDVENLQRQIEKLTSSYASATRQIQRLRAENEQLNNGAEIERLREVEAQFRDLTDRMKDEFSAFLQSNDLDPTQAWYGRFGDLFKQIEDGSLTAKEAITQVKDEFAALIQEGQSGGKVFSDAQVNEFISKLDEACTKIEEMRNEMRTLTDTAALRQVAQDMSESAELTDRQREALRAMVGESAGLTTVAQLLAELVKNFDATEHETVEATTALTHMLEKLNEIASIGEDGLHGVSSMFRSLDTITNIDVETKKIQNLIGALEDIADIPKLTALQALQNITLRGFDNMHVSKASLANLATYLPDIAKADVNKLRALSDVNLTNFNALSVKKPSVDNLKSLFEALGSLGVDIGAKEGAAVGDVNKLWESHESVLKAAAEAEKAKAAASGEVSTALKQESTAANEASIAADKDAAAAKRHSDAQRSVIDTLKNVQSAIHTLENTSGGKDQPLYKDLQGMEAMLTKLNEASGRMSAEQILRELSDLKLRQSEAAQSMNLFVLGVQDLERAEREAANAAVSAEKEQAKLDAALQKSVDDVEKLGQDFESVKARVEKIDTSRITEGFSAAYDRLRSTLNVLQSADTTPQDKLNAYKDWAMAIGTVNAYLKNMERSEREAAKATRESAKEDEARIAAQTRLQNLLNSVNGARGKAQTGGLETDADAYRKLAQEIQNVIDADGKLAWTSEDLRRVYALLNQEYAKLHGAADEHARDAQRIAEAEKAEAEAAKQLEDLEARIGKLKDASKVDQTVIDNIKALQAALNDEEPGSDTRAEKLKELKAAIDDATKSVKQLEDAERAEADAKKATETAEARKQTLLKQAEGLLQRVTRAQENWSKAQSNPATSGEYKNLEKYKNSLNTMIESLRSGDVDLNRFAADLRALNASFAHTQSVITGAGAAVRSYFGRGLQQLSSNLAHTFGFAAVVTKTIAEVKKMISTAVELDTAMNNLQIVTRGSTQDMEDYARSVSQIAKETAQSTKDLIDATTVYARLGYTMDESKTLAKYTAQLQNVGRRNCLTA